MRHLPMVLTALLVVSAVVALAEDAKETATRRFKAIESRIDQAEKARLDAYQALYDFVQEGLAISEGTPGKEPANYLRLRDFQKILDELKQGKRPGNWHWSVIRDNTIAAYQGPTWPKPPDVQVPRAAQPIKIDGKLDDPAWAKAVTFKDTYAFFAKEPTPDCQTTYRITWDDTYLYFAFDCVDADIIAPEMPRDDHVYFHDCVEMFILPEMRFRTYWELVIGPQGSIYDSIQCKNWNEWGLISKPTENIAGLQIGIKINGTLNDSTDKDQGYVVEIAVPFKQLPSYDRAKPAAGQTLHCMLVRLDKNSTGEKDDKGELKTAQKAYAFTPLMSWGHNLWNHARLTLAE